MYHLHCKIKTVFGLVSILFHCIYRRSNHKNGSVPSDPHWLQSNEIFLSPFPLTTEGELLLRTDTKFYTLPIFLLKEKGEWEESVGGCWVLYQITALLLCHSLPPSASPHRVGKCLFLVVTCFPRVAPDELKRTATAQCCAFTNAEIAQPLHEQKHIKLSQVKALPWDVPAFFLREATQVSPAAFAHCALPMSCAIRPKALRLNKTSSRVYSTTT